MRFWNVALPVVVVASAAADPAWADGGLLQKLPKDGTWVSYFMEMKASRGGMQESSGTVTIKSVGTETVNGEAYRWIELDFRGEMNGNKQHSVFKVLVREKDWKEEAKSGLTIARGWRMEQMGEGKAEPKELTTFERSSQGPMGAFFRCAMKNAKTVKKQKTVDYQKGQLKLTSATSGKLDVQFQENQPKDFSTAITQTVWNHKLVPIGVAALEMAMEVKRKDEVLVKMAILFTVQDYGKDAKSALPDKK